MLYKFLRWCPGLLGLFLRQKLYPRYLKKCASNVLFGRFVDIFDGRDTILIGSGVMINDFVTLHGISERNPGATLVIEDNVFIGSGTTVKMTGGAITIGSGSSLGSSCVVQSDQSVIIGNNVLVAAYCEIGKNYQKTVFSNARSIKGETRINSGCWLGVRAKINAEVKIGRGTIVGAHAMVTTDFPDNVVVIGNPAEVLRRRWENNMNTPRELKQK